MTVNTGGPIRGLIGRWVMRFEAAGQILRMGFQGTTAISAVSGVLAYSGYQQYVPYILVAALPVVFAFAYGYAEYGIFNRKNRERADRGNNFARPDMYIDDNMTGAAVFAAIHGREPTEEELEAIENAVDHTYNEYRNGIDA